MTATDLWPDFTIVPKPRGVRQVLEDAGSGLKEKTGGLLAFRVYPLTTTEEDFPVEYRCVLVVPKIGFEQEFCWVRATPTGFPVRLDSLQSDYGSVANEAELLAKLEALFKSDVTKHVVQNLISMATD